MKERLEAQYGTESNFNVADSTGEECACFPDGTAWAICTNWAHYVRRIEGDRAHIYGFFGEDNPDAEVNKVADGHDFALVDGRYLVDGWARHVEQVVGKAVLDLEDAEDAETVARIYGDRNLWERGEANEAMIDREPAHERERAMAGVVVIEEAMAPTFS